MTALPDFLGLSEAGFAQIAQYRSVLEAEADTLARAFYDYLLSYPITAAVFRDFTPERLDSLIQKQADHARGLLSSRLDKTWRDDMRAVGALHYRLGIQPTWVAGAYTLYWRHWQKVLYARVPLGDREALQDALFRLLTGDLMIQLEGYAEASRETDTERSALFHILLNTLTIKEEDAQSTESLLNRICDTLPRQSRSVVLAGYALRNADESLLQWKYQAGDWPSLGAEAPLGPGDPCWETLHRHEPLVQSVDDPSAPAWMQSLRGRAKEVGCFPFETDDLQGVGVVAVHSRGYFQQVGSIYFDAFASLGELVLRLRNESLRDPLTHLPNRRLFQDRLALALDQNQRQEKLLGIGILDLDGFKQINDSLGHGAGDQFLNTIAQRIQSTLRRGDTLARLGGDEFGLILPNLCSLDDLESLASRILDAVRSPIALAGEAVHPAASLGLTVHPLDDDTPEALLQHADLALYAAKTEGRDRFRLHDLQLEASRHAALEQRRLLENALERQWLTVVYQPIVSSTDGMTGVEALLRVQHPERGLLSPSAFFSALDHPQFARAVGRFVLDTALAQAQAWKKQGHSWRVAVNISTTHLLDPRFLGDLRELLQKYPELPPEQLEIEITESAPLRDLDAAQATLKACRELQVRIGLDDFGTGHASLIYLHHLPADVLKIDQGFVRDMLDDPKDLAIVTAFVTAGRMLGFEIVAEGVESEDQRRLLVQMGCSHLQGYRISRPRSSEAIAQWATRYHPDHLKYTSHALDILPAILQAQELRVAQFVRTLRNAGPVPGTLLEENAETHCHLGLWLRGDGAHRFATSPHFPGLLRRHAHLHVLAREAYAFLEQGDRAGALLRGEQLERENQELLLELTTLLEWPSGRRL